MLSVIMLRVIMLSANMLSVIMLSVNILSMITLSVAILNVFALNVKAPLKHRQHFRKVPRQLHNGIHHNDTKMTWCIMSLIEILSMADILLFERMMRSQMPYF
jgi:hypothetical protein